MFEEPFGYWHSASNSWMYMPNRHTSTPSIFSNNKTISGTESKTSPSMIIDKVLIQNLKSTSYKTTTCIYE